MMKLPRNANDIGRYMGHDFLLIVHCLVFHHDPFFGVLTL